MQDAFNASSKVAYEYLKQSLDQLKEEVGGKLDLNSTFVGSAILMSTGLSVGYVLWLVRGGMLMSTLLSSMPAWRLLDPLPILAGKLDEEDDEESLETILEDDAQDTEKAEKEPDEATDVNRTEK